MNWEWASFHCFSLNSSHHRLTTTFSGGYDTVYRHVSNTYPATPEAFNELSSSDVQATRRSHAYGNGRADRGV